MTTGPQASMTGAIPSRRGRRWSALALAGCTAAVATLVPAQTAGAVAASADLSVAVSHAPQAPLTGVDLTFTVTATNDGPDAAQAVVVGLAMGYPLSYQSSDADCDVSGYDGPSLLCDVGTLASGATATVHVVVRPEAKGVYVVPAAVSSTTPDPDTADLAVNDTLIVRPGPSMGERYVRGVFPKVLGRTPDAGAVAYWGTRYQTAYFRYPRKLEAVPAAWIGSAEYRRLRLRAAFDRILDRAPSAAELTRWTTQAAGGLSFEAIERRLLSSREFAGTAPGATQVSAAYQAVLGRAATSAEKTTATRKLAAGATFASVVLGVQRSTEGYDVVIDRHWQLALGKAPDAFGRYAWQRGLRTGATAEQLFARLLVSNEVAGQYRPTEDEYPYEDEFDHRAPAPIDAETGLPTYDFSS